ncbi:MAG: hypothetical protein KDE27_15765 [Planctomycetes bacterium]|nr:hypothetical protein [Planctomycetota bacterium]
MLATAIGAAHAQDRVATAGRVLDAERHAIANATVTFVGSAPPLGGRFAAPDRVVVVTDDKGRFRTDLRERHEYACWVVGSPSASGACAVSTVLDVRPGRGFEVELANERSPATLRVTGDAAWGAFGPLAFEVAIAAPHLHRAPLALVDGVATLPVLPWDSHWLLFARDRDGALLYSETLEPHAGAAEFVMPPPRTLAVRVADPQSVPIVGAEVFAEVDGAWRAHQERSLTGLRELAEWRRVGVTGQDGEARVTLASRAAAPGIGDEPLLWARMPGRAGAVGGWAGRFVVDGSEHAPLHRRDPLPFTLAPAAAFAGDILDDAGRPLARAQLALSAMLTIQLAGSQLSRPVTFRTVSDAEGHFEFVGLPPLLSAPTLLIDHPQMPILTEPALDVPLALDLRSIRRCEFAAIDAAGGPARAAEVLILPLPTEGFRIGPPDTRLRLDNRGRATLRIARGRWFVFVTDGIGFAHTELDSDAMPTLALEMQELDVLRGRVLLAEGARWSDVSFRVGACSHRDSGDEIVQALRALGLRVNQWLAARAPIEPDGTFALRFLAVDGSSYSGAAMLAGGGHCELRLEPTSEPLVLDLTGR